jgi:hypothetical protein
MISKDTKWVNIPMILKLTYCIIGKLSALNPATQGKLGPIALGEMVFIWESSNI